MIRKLYHLHTLTALHVGIGQGSGVIDLPIARERATNLPMVPGSALKGVLREELRPDAGEDRKSWEALFGPERLEEDQQAYAGALAAGDALLLCLAVRSLAGTFAYASCPLVLRRYARDCNLVDLPVIDIPDVVGEQCHTHSGTALRIGDRVCLEDLDLTIGSKTLDDWAEQIAKVVFPDDGAWRTLFQERFVVIPDKIFDFLSETATEVRARVRINSETRTVAKGALWYEENLPAESILWGVLGIDRSFNKQRDLKADELVKMLPPGETRLQIGGKATVGRGQVRWLL